MSDGMLSRLFKAALAPAADPAGQEELGRLARLLGLQEMRRLEPSPWVSVDPLHDSVEQRWSELGMPAPFEWIYAWTPAPVVDNGEPVLLCYIRRSRVTPNGCRGIDVPFEQVSAAEGFGFHVLGVVVPSDIDRSCWSISTASGTEITFMELEKRVQIPGHGEIGHQLSDRGLVRFQGPFNPSDPDKTTLARAHRALAMIPKHPGGRRRGWRKGQVWSAQQNVAWWLAWELDREPELSDYAAAIGLRDEYTAGQRWRGSGLEWPPTTAQLDEFSD